MKRRAKNKKLTVVVPLLIVLAVLGAVALLAVRNAPARSKTDASVTQARSYEDKEGFVYQCSRPVRVRNQGATYGNGTPSPTPINQSEATKYCHRTGIE